MKDLIMILAGIGIGYAIAKSLNTEGVKPPALPLTKCINTDCVTSVTGFRPPQHVF